MKITNSASEHACAENCYWTLLIVLRRVPLICHVAIASGACEPNSKTNMVKIMVAELVLQVVDVGQSSTDTYLYYRVHDGPLRARESRSNTASYKPRPRLLNERDNGTLTANPNTGTNAE